MKEKKKGRAIGEMVMGIRKDILGTGLAVEAKEEGIMVGRVGIVEERWKVVEVYVGRRRIEETLKAMERWMEGEGGKEKTIIGGDFNARTGKEGGGIEKEIGEKWEGRGRRSKDGVINREGRMMVNFLEERGWIYNGTIKGDEGGSLHSQGGKGTR